jgi:preprotein translocase subunit YajC
MDLNNIALVLFGAAFWYAILWSRAKNKKSKAMKARLALCDQSSAGKAERAQIYADDHYKFNFKAWAIDNSDEMVITGFSCVGLILFDTLAADIVKLKYDIELGDAVFLLGGIGGDIIYRAIDKMQNG